MFRRKDHAMPDEKPKITGWTIFKGFLWILVTTKGVTTKGVKATLYTLLINRNIIGCGYGTPVAD